MNEKKTESPVQKLARFVVDKRTAFFVLFAIACVYCAMSVSKTNINNSLTDYLPEGTETEIGLEIMEREFVTYGSAQVMVSNITFESAQFLAAQMEEIEGIESVTFDDEEEEVFETDRSDYYRGATALFSVSFTGEEESAGAEQAMEQLKTLLAGYDCYISSAVGQDLNATLAKEMAVILLIAVIVIAAVLLFTSKSYMEVLVFFIVFPVAAILNMGTNHFFKDVSFITNSIAIILQLALAIDYSIILCHRFMEELETKNAHDAAVDALSKAIIEISSSSLTTISGLLALTMMQFQLGLDMGRVLIKGILCSLITVFFLMPGILILFSKGIQKTRHKSFVPSIRGWGRLVVRLRYVLVAVFVVVAAGGVYFSGLCDYVFTETVIETRHPSVERIASDKISDTFELNNVIAMLVPKGDYASERWVLEQVEDFPEITTAAGLANTEIKDGYMLTDSLTPRQFSEMSDIDLELVRLLYQVYGISEEEYGAVVQGEDYAVPILDMFLFLCEQKQDGVITIDDEEQSQDLDDLYDTLLRAQDQLSGEEWTRLLFITDLPEEGPETYALLEEIRGVGQARYGEEVVLVGNSTNAKDLRDSFAFDNQLISALTAVFVLIILLFTFQSAGLPVLLVLTIQGSIWINFSFPYITDTNLFFIAYLIVSSIQMGATIDYAIVITNRYQELKPFMGAKEAVVEALNGGFATIFTSGSIMTIAGFLIGEMTTQATIGSIGTALGRGTLISMILVLTVLPALLVVGDKIIEKTAFTLTKDRKQRFHQGAMRLDGHMRGHVSGYIDAEFNGVIRGSVDAVIESKYQELETEGERDEEE